MLVMLALGCSLGLTPYGDTAAIGDSDTADHLTNDTNDTTDSGHVEPTGLVGGLVEMSLLQLACPGCFGASSDLQITADAAFVTPSSGSWLDRYPPVGSCDTNRTGNPPVSARLDVGQWVYLTSGSASIGMHRITGDGGLYYVADTLTNADFHRTAEYAISVPIAGDLPAFDQPNAILTPQGFASITPVELLYSDPYYAFGATLWKTGNNPFTWADAGGDGTFIVEVVVYDPSGSSQIGVVTCRGPDNGSMNVPGSAFAAYPSNSLLAVYLYRLSTGSFVLDANGATVETIATVGVLGTAVLAQ